MKILKTLLVASAISSFALSAAFASSAEMVKKGEKIFMTKKLGNCIACHDVNGKSVDGPGSMGPKLQGLQYWPEQALYDKIYDPYTTNPISQMPAFGKNGWLNDAEINALVAYLKTVK